MRKPTRRSWIDRQSLICRFKKTSKLEPPIDELMHMVTHYLRVHTVVPGLVGNIVVWTHNPTHIGPGDSEPQKSPESFQTTNSEQVKRARVVSIC